MLLAYLPPDKVYRRGADDFIEQEKNESEEAQSNVNAYQKVVKVTGIDLQKGLDNCGGSELLLEVLKDFYLSIDDKAEKIQQYKDEGDIKNYTIFVHGLKSSARTIGAMKLSDLAAMLERAGNENNAEEIDKWTPVLLECYRSYKGQIKPAIIENDDVDLPEIPEDELMNALGSIREFVEASYFDSADDIMKMLSGYRIPSEYREKVDKLQKLMSEVDRDGILSLL
jgi:HPt (histidine-containing phosphotransfer) domain-containing protein